MSWLTASVYHGRRVMDLTLSMTSPLPPEPLVLRVELEGRNQVHVLVEEGWFQGEVAARPLSVVGVTALPEGAALLRSRSPSPAAPLDGERPAVDIVALFRDGVAVPEGGALRLHLLWLAPCDGAAEETVETTRFGSVEHSLCALLIGKGANGKRLEHHGIRAHFTGESTFDVGGKPLDFGMIIALAGDFYAHLDDRARTDFAWAWPPMESIVGWLAGDYRGTTLAGDTAEAVKGLHDHIHAEAAGIQFGGVAKAIDSVRLKHPMRRYLALASQNHCHFACQDWSYSEQGNPALDLYRAYHRRALEEARAAGKSGERAGLDAALVVDAFGCHFLTDLFASGHIRTPRAVLGERFGIAMGALVMSKRMHDEDNRKGLWVTPLQRGDGPRVVWRAYGDDCLFKPEAKAHFAQIQEAVRRSAAEVFAAYCEGASGMPVQAGPRAEELIPVPLLPGEGPAPASDVLPDGQSSFPDHPPNHAPMYRLLEDGRVAERVFGKYVPLERPAGRSPEAVVA